MGWCLQQAMYSGWSISSYEAVTLWLRSQALQVMNCLLDIYIPHRVCYSGATWDCNNSNSLISNESLTHIRQLSVNVSTWLRLSCRDLTAGCLTKLIPPFTLQRQTEIKQPISELSIIWYQLCNDSPRSISLCQLYRLVGFLFADDITGDIVVTHLFAVP